MLCWLTCIRLSMVPPERHPWRSLIFTGFLQSRLPVLILSCRSWSHVHGGQSAYFLCLGWLLTMRRLRLCCSMWRFVLCWSLCSFCFPFDYWLFIQWYFWVFCCDVVSLSNAVDNDKTLLQIYSKYFQGRDSYRCICNQCMGISIGISIVISMCSSIGGYYIGCIFSAFIPPYQSTSIHSLILSIVLAYQSWLNDSPTLLIQIIYWYRGDDRRGDDREKLLIQGFW